MLAKKWWHRRYARPSLLPSDVSTDIVPIQFDVGWAHRPQNLKIRRLLDFHDTKAGDQACSEPGAPMEPKADCVTFPDTNPPE